MIVQLFPKTSERLKGKWTGRSGRLQSMGLQSRTRLSNCTELNGNTENRFVDTTRVGEVEMNSESNMETHITICKIASQWEFAI